MCLIDLNKAFSWVRIKDILQLLHDRRILLDLSRTKENIYKNNVAMVVNVAGIRQEDPLSKLINEIQILCQVNDAIIMVANEDHLQRLFKEFVETATQ